VAIDNNFQQARPSEPGTAEGGEVRESENIERDPTAPELFFDSQIYESADGAEYGAWDGILDADSVSLAYKIASKRTELGIESDPQLIPADEHELIQLVRDGVREMIKNRSETENDTDMTTISGVPTATDSEAEPNK
jgi:hypothetical protein